MSSGYSPQFKLSVTCQEPLGVPAHVFVTDKGLLPATVPGASGNKILGVAEYPAKFGESLTVITDGTALVISAGLAGAYEEITISGSPPTATLTVTDNGSFVSSNASGQAVAAGIAGATDVGLVAPKSYAKQAGDLIEVILSL